MIRIHIKSIHDLNKWYSDQMIPWLPDLWKKREESGKMPNRKEDVTLSAIQNEFLKQDEIKVFLDYVKNMPEDHLRQLLTIPIYDMDKEAPNLYIQIKSYWEFCRWYVGSKQYIDMPGNSEENADKAKARLLDQSEVPSWKSTFETCWKSVLPNLEGVSDFEEKTKRIKQYHKLVEEAINAVNQKIRENFYYGDLKPNIRKGIPFHLDIKVCPYCNQAFVQSLTQVDQAEREKYEQYLGDLDHMLPKSIYALFCLSIWNLIPSCKACNQSFKSTDTVELLNPLLEGFEDDCHLSVDWTKKPTLEQLTGHDDKPLAVCWMNECNGSEPERIRKKSRIQNSINTFKLDLQYNIHGALVQDTLRRKSLWSSSYRDTVEEFLNQLEYKNLTTEECNRLLYGVSLNAEKDQYEIHGKMIRDILEWENFHDKFD